MAEWVLSNGAMIKTALVLSILVAFGFVAAVVAREHGWRAALPAVPLALLSIAGMLPYLLTTAQARALGIDSGDWIMNHHVYSAMGLVAMAAAAVGAVAYAMWVRGRG